MLDVIEKLLILQERDRKILRLRNELSRIAPERKMIEGRGSAAAQRLDSAKLKVRELETERKKLELDVDAKKQAIEKFSLQQFQTKKNEEFKALGHQIENARVDIQKLEDQQIEFMEKIEAAQREVAASIDEDKKVKQMVGEQIADLEKRNAHLEAELKEMEAGRTALSSVVPENVLSKYERLLKSKGDKVVVGIEHGVCGGCHMKFPTQVVLQCRAAQEIVSCPNCSRILYYTRDMDLAVAE